MGRKWKIQLFFSIFLLCVLSIYSEQLPFPGNDNTFYILPINEQVNTNIFENAAVNDIYRLKNQIQDKIYHKTGFSVFHESTGTLFRTLELAKQTNLKVGIILSIQTHTPQIEAVNLFDTDIRVYQWRLDGETWKGLLPDDVRDYKVPTPSRYALLVRNYYEEKAYKLAKDIKIAMDASPGVIAAISAVIEEQLASGGEVSDNYLADYSPFTITEFRDWLQHRGIYKDDAKYSGQGAPEEIVGNYIFIEGLERSPFYDDPNPQQNNGTGLSLNEKFGTNFTTWNLRYWDLDVYPNSIVDENDTFDPTPEQGLGFINGGFDAPRVRNINLEWWKAWSWDVQDQALIGDAYPVGDPLSPAFGFRQHLVKHFVSDICDILVAEGLPAELIYPHQFAGDILSNDADLTVKNRSGATPVWTGLYEANGNLGITCFKEITDISRITKYSDEFGFFNWHPCPGIADPYSMDFYNRVYNQLTNFYNSKAHIFFPGKWTESGQPDPVYPFSDCEFSKAVNEFIANKSDNPYYLSLGSSPKYDPPRIWDIKVNYLSDTQIEVYWPAEIWEDDTSRWSMWSEFSHFELEESNDSITWNRIVDDNYQDWWINSYSVSSIDPTKDYYYRVRATNEWGVSGPWSKLGKLKNVDSLEIIPDSNCIAEDSMLSNRIIVKAKDDQNNLVPITSSPSGGTFTRIDNHGTKFQTLYYNNDNAVNPSYVIINLFEDQIIRDVDEAGVVEFTAPIGSNINGICFDYLCNYDNKIVNFELVDINGNILWNNDVFGKYRNFAFVYIPQESRAIRFRLRMKKRTSAQTGAYGSASGIKIFYDVTPASDNYVSATIYNKGVINNTKPENYSNATHYWGFNSLSDIIRTNHLVDYYCIDGIFEAQIESNFEDNPYIAFNVRKVINGHDNPRVFFRIKSDIEQDVQLKWTWPGGDEPGEADIHLGNDWAIYSLIQFSQEWNKPAIDTFWMEFQESGSKLKFDWIIITTPNINTPLDEKKFLFENGIAYINTSPKENGYYENDYYTIIAEYQGLSNSSDPINVVEDEDTCPPTSVPTPYPTQAPAYNAFIENRATTYTESNGVVIKPCSEGGENIGEIDNGDWVRFNHIDFREGATMFSARIASSKYNGKIEIRLNAVDDNNTLIGTFNVPYTGTEQTWETLTCPISYVEGIYDDLYLRFSGNMDDNDLFNLQWFKFIEFTPSPTPFPPCGDVNNDGNINILDAFLVARYYVGLNPDNFDTEYADIDGNGYIDIIDALLIARYYVELLEKLPCQV